MVLPVVSDIQSRTLMARLYSAGAVFAVVILSGAIGYRLIGGDHWSFADCLYMSVITLSTVGFGETLEGMDTMPGARLWTGTLILLGSGTMLYFASTLTALIVEGDLRGAIRRRRMSHLLDGLTQHIIVCGAGATGTHVVHELHDSHIPYVVVDNNESRIQRLVTDLGSEVLFVVGDATEDTVLQRAGIATARGLIAALHEDRDNLFITVTARALSDRIRIVAKAVHYANVTKLERGGADSVVAPAFIGGLRMAHEMVRPSVLQFLDQMVNDHDQVRRIEEIALHDDSRWVGQTLATVDLAHAVDALVIAVRFPDGHHEYNPSPGLVLQADMGVLVLVSADDVAALRAHVDP